MPASSEPNETVAILGGGNLGQALALGWTRTGRVPAERLTVTRRRVETLRDLAGQGIRVTDDNRAAVRASDIAILAVQPQQVTALLESIRHDLAARRHLLISVVSGVRIADIAERVGSEMRIVRAMPNTAIAIGESMTCLAVADDDTEALERAASLFETVGRTLAIREEMMVAATALCACGVAFFLRAIRAASQGGIEIGFHPEEALLLAAQTARGAASLLLQEERHPEAEIDRVTTPRGCTIAGLNEMEHQGFSSALIKGILLSAQKAAGLFDPQRRT
jgi:pyrroline-5-carboxylate reductase